MPTLYMTAVCDVCKTKLGIFAHEDPDNLGQFLEKADETKVLLLCQECINTKFPDIQDPFDYIGYKERKGKKRMQEVRGVQ